MQKHTIIILLFLFCFPGIECRAQSSIYFMGNPGDSETIQDFIVENDSSAIALINQELPQFDQRMIVVKYDTAFNFLKSKRLYHPTSAIAGNFISNLSNAKFCIQSTNVDLTNFKAYTSISLFNENLDTISNIRLINYSNNYFGYQMLHFDFPIIFGLVTNRDNAGIDHYILTKIDMIGRNIVEQKEILPPPGKILQINDFAVNHSIKEIYFAAFLSTDSINNYFNPCYLSYDSNFVFLTNLVSGDTIHPSNSYVNIKQVNDQLTLLGYCKSDLNSSTGKFFIGLNDRLNSFFFQKLTPLNWLSFKYALSHHQNNNNIISVLTGKTVFSLDSNGTILDTKSFITNPIFGISRLFIRGIYKWNEKHIAVGGFDFGTPNFDIALMWLDSNLNTCDQSHYNYIATDTSNNLTIHPGFQTFDVDSIMGIDNISFYTDSTNFPLSSYCSYTDLQELSINILNEPIIFPNPVISAFEIKNITTLLKSDTIHQAEIYDSFGREVKTLDRTKLTEKISVDELSNGFYIFILHLSSTRTISIKFAKI